MAQITALLKQSEAYGEGYTDISFTGIPARMFTVKPNDDLPQCLVLVNLLFDYENQRKGFGRAAVEALFRWAAQNGYREIELESIEDAVGFWEAMGFEECGEASEVDWVRMYRSVPCAM